MTSSRRGFLRSLGFGAAAGAAVNWPWGEISAASELTSSRSAKSDRFIRLDSNENPYGPSPKVAAAVRSATGAVNRYPFRKYEEVTERIASFHKVKPEQVLIGCGSTELLRAAACAFLGSGRRLIQPWPTFEAIQYYARSVGSEVVSVPLNRSYAHDLDAMLSHDDASTGLVYVCNPNNPTSSLTPRKDLEKFIGQLNPSTRVVIDEAYHDYVVPTGSYSSFINNPLKDERIIVTRTFSKVYGLAGLRLGYAVASPKIIERMRQFLTQDGLNAIVAEVVGVALDDVDGVREFEKRNRDDRQEFLNRANGRNLRSIDPHANFVMLDVTHPAEEVIEHFRKHNVLTGRRFPLLDHYVRVSFGTPDEMSVFWRTWDMLPWSNKVMHH
jgi:histidinol-phosphate aminotransferase